MKHSPLLLIAGILISGTAFFASRHVTGAAGLLREQGSRNPELLMPAILLMSAAVIWYGVSWLIVLGQLGATKQGNWSLLRFFLVTWPARYVPGTVPYHAARVLMARKIGATQNAVMASIAYEMILSLGSAAAIGTLGVTLEGGVRESIGSLYVLGMVPLIVLPAVLHPRVFFPVANKLLTVTGRQPLSGTDILTARQLLTALSSYSLVHLLNGLAFYCCVVGLGGAPVSPFLAIGAFSLAAALGVAAIFVPGGIGVREAVIVGLLGTSLSPEDALLVAAIARAVSVAADLAPFAVISLYSLLSKVAGYAHNARLPSRERIADPPRNS